MNNGCYFSEKLNSLIHITDEQKVIMMVGEKVIPMTSYLVVGSQMKWIQPRRALKNELEGVISHSGQAMKFTGWISNYGNVDENFELVS